MKQSQYPGLLLSEPQKDNNLVSQFEDFVSKVDSKPLVTDYYVDSLLKEFEINTKIS